MTTLLAELIEKIETLPPEIRVQIAKQILEDVENKKYGVVSSQLTNEQGGKMYLASFQCF